VLSRPGVTDFAASASSPVTSAVWAEGGGSTVTRAPKSSKRRVVVLVTRVSSRSFGELSRSGRRGRRTVSCRNRGRAPYERGA